MLRWNETYRVLSRQQKEAKTRLKSAVDRIFNDSVMIGLVMALALVVIFQLLHPDLSPGMKLILDIVNYVVICAFIAEYVLKLYVTDKPRISFITNPLHVLDLLIIIIALLDFSQLASRLPVISNYGDLSPMLRLLRVPLRGLLTLALVIKGKNEIQKKNDESNDKPPQIDPMKIVSLSEDGKQKEYSNENEGNSLWTDIQNITENISQNDWEIIKDITKFKPNEIEKILFGGAFTRIDHIEKFPAILLWDSKTDSNGDKKNGCTIHEIKPRILIIFKADKVFTLETGNDNLFDRITDLKCPLEKETFTVQILYSLLKMKIEDYQNIVQKIEFKTNDFERKTIDDTSSKFLHETFRFRRELQEISDNLWHFHQVLDQIIDKEEDLINLEIDEFDRSKFNKLHSESKYLCRKARNIRESLSALIDLHVNTVS